VTEPLRVRVDLDCPAAHAFDTWTARLGSWWPRGHTVSGDPAADVVLEPFVGGRILERTPDGRETPWGEVTAWEPPRRLAYLWHLRRDRADATDVELVFTAIDDRTCRLDITHTGWERLGAEAETWRDANRGGWSGLIPHFVTAATTRPHEATTRGDTRGDNT
jgi:hypothetical protein